jgi:hypothetical protein
MGVEGFRLLEPDFALGFVLLKTKSSLISLGDLQGALEVVPCGVDPLAVELLALGLAENVFEGCGATSLPRNSEEPSRSA